MSDNVIEIYTDGSCNNKANDRFGGWAYCIKINDLKPTVFFGSGIDTTSSRMELTAILEALRMLKQLDLDKTKVNIYSDSQYIIGMFNEKWYETWETKQFIGVKNEDLIRGILRYYRSVNSIDRRNTINFIKVKGHSNIEGNEIVDRYAKEARKKIMISKNPKELKWFIDLFPDNTTKLF